MKVNDLIDRLTDLKNNGQGNYDIVDRDFNDIEDLRVIVNGEYVLLRSHTEPL